MNKEHNHKHSGHRQRLKDKVRKTNLRTLADHEIIELLLTYTIPRKDTNPLAHELLQTFSSLDRVIDANVADLQKVEGVGRETALFFKIISDLFAVYKESKSKDKVKLNSTGACVEYFRKCYEVTANEFMAVVCISKTGNVVGSFYVNGKNDHEINIDIKEFADKINLQNTSSIVLYHTHPHGDVTPSREDVKTTQDIYNICAVLRINVVDHIIFNETEHYSFAKEGVLEEIANNCKLVYPDYYKVVKPNSKRK